MVERVGVRYDESHDVWIAEVVVGRDVVYRGDYGDPDVAAVGREIAIVKNRWDAARNFPDKDLAGLCKLFKSGIQESLSGKRNTWHRWVENIGLEPEEFLRLAR